MPQLDDPLDVRKPDGRRSCVAKPVSMVVTAVLVVLAAYALAKLGQYAGWPPVAKISPWFALPAAIAVVGIAAQAGASPIPSAPGRLAEVLPKLEFLDRLRRERLRADRSRVPLSIALFCFENGKGAALDDPQTQSFIEFLRSCVRETDLLGHLGEHRLGLLLTDTDENGSELYVRKLLSHYGAPPATIVTKTYPDQIFQQLMAEGDASPEVYPFFLDAADTRRGYRLKRGLDVVGAVVGIVLFSPVMAVTALAVKLTSPGPVIFRQTRLGENGVPFTFYKFRSMVCDADDRIHREYVTSLITGNIQAINQGNHDAPLYKLTADPRVTPVGRFIRRTSIDELPQFFNVLKGEMSLVGPRPPLPYEAKRYQPWHFRRIFEMKPGITGLWQVEGRSKTSFDEMVRLDLQYLRASSLRLDLKLLLRTVKVVLKGSGAV